METINETKINDKMKTINKTTIISIVIMKIFKIIMTLKMIIRTLKMYEMIN